MSAMQLRQIKAIEAIERNWQMCMLIENYDLASDEKYWIKRILVCKSDGKSTDLKSLLCEFSQRNLRFQTRYDNLTSFEFNQMSDIEFDLWPPIQKVVKQILSVLDRANCSADRCPPERRQRIRDVITSARSKFSNQVQFLRLRHPDSTSDVNRILEYQSRDAMQELDNECKTQ
tara:strand:- start:2092 stop:2613 length:522 start_codon:yes stop_codon:yes gene_type:complete